MKARKSRDFNFAIHTWLKDIVLNEDWPLMIVLQDVAKTNYQKKATLLDVVFALQSAVAFENWAARKADP